MVALIVIGALALCIIAPFFIRWITGIIGTAAGKGIEHIADKVTKDKES